MNATTWWQRGREAEALGTPSGLAAALDCFDRARALLAGASAPEEIRLLGRVWMNRGNLLQKQGTPVALVDALAAYDAAIAVLDTLPRDPVVQNHLGSAWLNRGHALQRFAAPERLAEAVRSLRTAVELLRPLAAARAEPSAPANLAGALINLADTLIASELPGSIESARAAALEALDLAATAEMFDPLWAELGLMARRAHAAALAYLLADVPANPFVGEASDTIDSGLALARRWEHAGVSAFRPFTERFFRFGVEFYRRHQPHFLAEFVLETLVAPDSPTAWVAMPDIRHAAHEAIDGALADLRAPRLLIAGDRQTERTLATHRALMLAQTRLGRVFSREGPDTAT